MELEVFIIFGNFERMKLEEFLGNSLGNLIIYREVVVNNFNCT